MSIKVGKLLFYNIIAFILSYYIAVLCHEYGHATMAWIFGYKTSPLDIYYGSWYLLPVSENVDYLGILAAGHDLQVALIGVAGITVTIILFFVSLYFLRQAYILNSPFLLSFFFWFLDINLMEIFSYVPNRTFIMGDIGELVMGLHISPVWVLVLGTPFVCYALYRFYQDQIIKMYRLLPITSHAMQRFVLWLTFWPVGLAVVYWEPPTEYIFLSYATNFFCLIFILFLLAKFDPASRAKALP